VQKIFKVFLLIFFFKVLISTNSFSKILQQVEENIDKNAKYIFYMHGAVLEWGGRRSQDYRYNDILSELFSKGFVVIGETRNFVNPNEYADKVASQVNKLLSAGVIPKNITIAGHSKGGLIAMISSSIIQNSDIVYVNFAGCGLAGSQFERGTVEFSNSKASRSKGYLISVYDRSDAVSGSCKVALDKMVQTKSKEIVLEVGGGHELFYKPHKDWIQILVNSANRSF